jgi:hypothetical protein
VAPIKDDKIDDQELVDDHCQITMLRWHALLRTVVVPIVNQMYQRNFFIFIFMFLIRIIDVELNYHMFLIYGYISICN